MSITTVQHPTNHVVLRCRKSANIVKETAPQAHGIDQNRNIQRLTYHNRVLEPPAATLSTNTHSLGVLGISRG